MGENVIAIPRSRIFLFARIWIASPSLAMTGCGFVKEKEGREPDLLPFRGAFLTTIIRFFCQIQKIIRYDFIYTFLYILTNFIYLCILEA